MGSRAVIDVGFDVRTDAGGGDPDRYSATLRRYHQLLWSKPLPSGEMFDLDADLHHASDLGEFWLSSDSIVHTYSTWQQPARLVQVVQQVHQTEVTAFNDLACTVGGYLVFPMQVHVDGRWRRSINQSRGFHPRIRDRFDLTLECIRRHYEGTPSPLDGTLAWYADFFGLFGDFGGYVDHFLLQDLVEDGQGSVRFFTDIDDVTGDPLPASSVAEYRQYMSRSMAFLRARNARIADYATSALDDRT
jgi:hypothetical protein